MCRLTSQDNTQQALQSRFDKTNGISLEKYLATFGGSKFSDVKICSISVFSVIENIDDNGKLVKDSLDFLNFSATLYF